MYSRHRCLVENKTLSSTSNSTSLPQCQFTNSAWSTLAARRLSWASLTSRKRLLINFVAASASGTLGVTGASGFRGGMSQGDHPTQSWKGEKPVLALTVFIIAKWTQGNYLAQPFWLHST